MNLIINIIGAAAFFLGLYLVYLLRKQSQIYTSSIINDADAKTEQVVNTDSDKLNTGISKGKSPAEPELQKTLIPPLNDNGNKEIFSQAIIRHLAQSNIYPLSSKSIKSHTNKKYIDEIFNVYENSLSDSKFSNSFDLYRVLYKTRFSSEIIDTINNMTSQKKDRVIIILYSELLTSLKIYENILNNESKYNADIINYDVAMEKYRFHYDIPENKLNQVNVYLNQKNPVS